MKYKINDVFIHVNDEPIMIGVALGEKDDKESIRATEIIPISEYESGLKKFIYGKQRYCDLVYHSIGNYSTTGEPKGIDKKWIDELVLMGYDVSKIKYYLKCGD